VKNVASVKEVAFKIKFILHLEVKQCVKKCVCFQRKMPKQWKCVVTCKFSAAVGRLCAKWSSSPNGL
jgi:hypothetical protein